MMLQITATGLNLRAAPAAPGGRVLRVLPKGTRVTMLVAHEGWRFVRTGDGAEGWVSAEFTTPVSEPAPTILRPLSFAEREKLLGRIEFVREPAAADPDAIRVTNGWTAQNVVRADIPQIAGLPGANAVGTAWVHRRVRAQLVELFAAWERFGLRPLLLTWGGCHNARLIRGSTTTLSQHAHGSAIDINVPWNGLEKTPAAKGTRGSVHELVPLAEEHGFYWGGFFSRVDAMHFELARLL